MKLSRKKLLKGCEYSLEVDELLTKAEKALRTWEPIWTKFVAAPIREEALKVFKEIADLTFSSSGGFPRAERQRILVLRKEQEGLIHPNKVPISAIKIEGNFLFDRTTPNDFLQALTNEGIEIEDIGDIWTIGDRGAQAICTPEATKSLANRNGLIRDVEIKYKSTDLKDLKFPLQRIPKKLTSIEASQRIDAIASAGFGLSRAKITSAVKGGRLRLNWYPIKNSRHAVKVGDRIQLEGKGSIEILSLEITKRERWRVELIRQ